MAELDCSAIEQAIAKYQDRYLKTDLVSAGLVKQITLDNDAVIVEIKLGFPVGTHGETIKHALTKQLKELGLEDITIKVSSEIFPHTIQSGLQGASGIKNIIAVASGKGGVGKSTTSVNLALALQEEGAKVGILDADIYGPSEAILLGARDTKVTPSSNDTLEPVERYGLQTMSIAYMIDDEDTPVVWRGPMVTRALMQLLNDTKWSDLDYLIVDMPPGTGDIQLTMAQKIPVSGVVMITTPQDLAMVDVSKSMAMFEKVSVPVLGLIENMSVYVCAQCGHHEHIFGEGGTEKLSERYDVPLLGSLPLDARITRANQRGKPCVADEPDSAISLCYRDVALQVAAALSLQGKDRSRKFPKITVEQR